MTADLQGRVSADRGNTSQKLFAALWHPSLKLITGIAAHQCNHLMSLLNKLLLRKKFIIETLFDKFKSQMGLEHTRHGSPVNAFVHIFSRLVAYTLGKANVKMADIAYP